MTRKPTFEELLATLECRQHAPSESCTTEAWVFDLLTAEGEHVMQVGVAFADKAEAHDMAGEAMSIYQRADFAIFSKVTRSISSDHGPSPTIGIMMARRICFE